MVNLDVSKGNESSLISVPIVFGCSNLQSGALADHYRFDGVFGFGPSQMSFNSQLHSLGLSPRVFSLCMKSSDGGGILVLDKIVEPGLVYTPLLPSKHHTFVDSGTTLAYLADGAYDTFVSVIAAAVSPHVCPSVNNGIQCFITSSRVNLSFLSAMLQFAGGATLALKPQNYLRLSDDQLTYCIAWLRSKGKQVTILGDIVLMDKIIVHDMESMRLGWMDYDCTLNLFSLQFDHRFFVLLSLPLITTMSFSLGNQPVNVTTSSGKKHGHTLYNILLPIGVALMLTHMLLFRHT